MSLLSVQKWAARLVFLSGVSFGLAACDPGTGATSENETSNIPPTPVTAIELAKAYEDNEAAAQQAYGNKPLLVSGTVTAISLDFSDEPVVQMRGANEFSDVQLKLADSAHAGASSVKKGQKLTLRCEEVGEVIGTPMLQDCTFSENVPAESVSNTSAEKK